MRGKGCFSVYNLNFLGITPAYAGKSLPRAPVRFVKRDHPRVCGEKQRGKLRRTTMKGSPPHMRGKAQKTKKLPGRCRITPACAGKRRTACPQTARPKDHPRMCGEKKCPLGSLVFSWGSPPHVRGKEMCVISVFDTFGITPACAGKSNRNEFLQCNNRYHPRMCGEKIC